MVLPIYVLGHPVLRRKTKVVETFDQDFEELVRNMWDTMYFANGVGLAAPQIGQSLRLFMVDTIQVQKEGEEEKGIKEVFINAQILEESGEEWEYEEGCLSIPEIRADVSRLPKIKITYLDKDFAVQTKEFEGINARVIQHEYDHIEGVLFIDKTKPLRRKMLSRKLEKVKKGKIGAEYPTRLG